MIASNKKLLLPAQHMCEWLFYRTFPHWLEYGIDIQNGGFFESLDMDGKPQNVNFKRTRVTARQIYAFSHAALLGVDDCFEAAEHGINFLLGHHRGEAVGSWVRRVDKAGKTIDKTDDLYDISFVLFALAWWYRLTSDKNAIKLAQETLQYMKILRHPSGYGYLSSSSSKNISEQNPHMHLLEALIELFKVTKDEQFLHAAIPLIKLFTRKFLVNNTLREFFQNNWEVADGISGKYCEPGHMSEWVWIIFNYGKIVHHDASGLIESMMNFVQNSALKRVDGLLPDIVLDDGSIHISSVRLWPQTEFIKGLIARSEFFAEDHSSEITRVWLELYRSFLSSAPTGCWHDHLDYSGRIIIDKVPASSLYHLTLACSELMRTSGYSLQ